MPHKLIALIWVVLGFLGAEVLHRYFAGLRKDEGRTSEVQMFVLRRPSFAPSLTHHSSSNTISCAPCQSTMRPSSRSCSRPSTIVRK